jgi:hypothetical protein
MTSPAPDWVEQARRFVAGSGLADALTAVSAGLGDAGGGPTPAAGTAEDSGAGAPADHSAECRWCPLCAGLAAVRGRRPDLLEGLADVLATAAAVLRTHAATVPDSAAGTGEGAGPAPAEPAAEETVAEPSPASVQRIEVA